MIITFLLGSMAILWGLSSMVHEKNRRRALDRQNRAAADDTWEDHDDVWDQY